MSFTPGWNDPPEGISWQSANGNTRALLTRRVGQTQPNSSPAPTVLPTVPVGMFVPSENVVEPAPIVIAPAFIPPLPHFTDDALINSLTNSALNATQGSVLDKNVTKKLERLKEQLSEGKVSPGCREKLCQLVQCIVLEHFDQAYELQARLMIEHQPEVKDWLAAPKNIIILNQRRS